LTERGREQARTAGRMLAIRSEFRIQAAVSSALSRCRETLDLILPELPYPVQRLADSPDLNERSLGEFEGRRDEDVYAELPEYRDDPALNQFDNHPTQKSPGGESLNDVARRTWVVVARLDETYSGDVLIVSHFTTIRCLLGQALDLPTEVIQRMTIPNATPIVIERANGFRLVDGHDRLGL